VNIDPLHLLSDWQNRGRSANDFLESRGATESTKVYVRYGVQRDRKIAKVAATCARTFVTSGRRSRADRGRRL